MGQVFSDLHYHNPPLRGESTSIKRAHPPHKRGVRKISFFIFIFIFLRMKLELKVSYRKNCTCLQMNIILTT